MAYNRSFKIDIEEMKLLESALRLKLANLLDERAALSQHDCSKNIDAELERVTAFLGSLHNQKNWYRPKDRIYVSG